MRLLFRITLEATCISALSWLIVENTALALTTAGDIVLFEVPFTDKAYRFPIGRGDCIRGQWRHYSL